MLLKVHICYGIYCDLLKGLEYKKNCFLCCFTCIFLFEEASCPPLCQIVYCLISKTDKQVNVNFEIVTPENSTLDIKELTRKSVSVMMMAITITTDPMQ